MQATSTFKNLKQDNFNLFVLVFQVHEKIV